MRGRITHFGGVGSLVKLNGEILREDFSLSVVSGILVLSFSSIVFLVGILVSFCMIFLVIGLM